MIIRPSALAEVDCVCIYLPRQGSRAGDLCLFDVQEDSTGGGRNLMSLPISGLADEISILVWIAPEHMAFLTMPAEKARRLRPRSGYI